jgi:hypothetical protein
MQAAMLRIARHHGTARMHERRSVCSSHRQHLADAAVVGLQDAGDHGALEAGRVGRHLLRLLLPDRHLQHGGGTLLIAMAGVQLGCAETMIAPVRQQHMKAVLSASAAGAILPFH